MTVPPAVGALSSKPSAITLALTVSKVVLNLFLTSVSLKSGLSILSLIYLSMAGNLAAAFSFLRRADFAVSYTHLTLPTKA